MISNENITNCIDGTQIGDKDDLIKMDKKERLNLMNFNIKIDMPFNIY